MENRETIDREEFIDSVREMFAEADDERSVGEEVGAAIVVAYGPPAMVDLFSQDVLDYAHKMTVYYGVEI